MARNVVTKKSLNISMDIQLIDNLKRFGFKENKSVSKLISELVEGKIANEKPFNFDVYRELGGHIILKQYSEDGNKISQIVLTANQCGDAVKQIISGGVTDENDDFLDF